MSQLAFDLAFPLAVPFWALMILAPRWSVTRRIVGSPLIVVVPLAAYLLAIVPILPEFAAEMLSPDLAGVREIVATADGTAAIWAHLIAFDLFVGRWMYLDSRERGVHPLLMAPVLVLTILLSPFGLLAYLLLRSAAARRGVDRANTDGVDRAETDGADRAETDGADPAAADRRPQVGDTAAR